MFEGEFYCLRENNKKYKTFSVTITKEVKRIGKMEKKLQKPYLTNYNLLIAQELWQDHYQILIITLPKEFIKLNANINMITKKCKTCGIKYKDCECYLEYTDIKVDLILTSVDVAIGITKKIY